MPATWAIPGNSAPGLPARQPGPHGAIRRHQPRKLLPGRGHLGLLRRGSRQFQRLDRRLSRRRDPGLDRLDHLELRQRHPHCGGRSPRRLHDLRLRPEPRRCLDGLLAGQRRLHRGDQRLFQCHRADGPGAPAFRQPLCPGRGDHRRIHQWPRQPQGLDRHLQSRPDPGLHRFDHLVLPGWNLVGHRRQGQRFSHLAKGPDRRRRIPRLPAGERRIHDPRQ